MYFVSYIIKWLNNSYVKLSFIFEFPNEEKFILQKIIVIVFKTKSEKNYEMFTVKLCEIITKNL